MDLDGLQEKIGGLSTFQLWVLFGACALSFGSAFTTQSGVIFSTVLPHRCSVDPIDNETMYPDLTEDDILNYTIPEEDGEYSSCYRYNYTLSDCTGGDDFSCITGEDTVAEIPCDNGWVYDDTYYEENTISEWDLVCDRRTLDSMANSLFFFGWFLGSFTFGPLSDWSGRKLACLIYAIGLILANLITAFIQTFWVYVFMRVIVGGCAICTFLATYAYVAEIMTYKTRILAAAYENITNGVAHIIMPWTGYLFRDWRYVSVFNAAIVVPYLFIYPFLPRSPRWLIVEGKTEEARSFVEKCAKSNGTEIDDEEWKEVVVTENEKMTEGVGLRFTILDLFRRPLTRVVSCNVAYCWFVVSMVYFGLTLNGGNLAGNPYINTTLNSVAEVLAHLAYYACGSLGRVNMLSMTFAGSGLCCLLSMMFDLIAGVDDEGLITAGVVMAITGKFFASWAFDLVYSVAAESYPTPVRATGLSLGSMSARIGGMITPFTLQLQYRSPWISQSVFGSLSLIAAATTFLFPETKDAEFITTLDEAEYFYMLNMPKTRKFLGIHMPEDGKGYAKSNPGFKSDSSFEVEKESSSETKF